MEWWAECSAEAVLTVAPHLARRLVSEGIDPDRVHSCPPGVDAALFDKSFDDPFPQIGRPRVLFVGRFAPQKGLRVLTTATSLLENLSAQVLLVGNGPERPLLEREIQRLGVGDRMHLLGFISHEQIPAVMAHADLLVLPSIYEELGTVLLEAMQAGLPVVASKTGGIPDVVTDGVNGLLVPPGDPDALAHAIDRILAERELTRRLAEAARERARDYDWNALADRVLEIYRGVTVGRS